MSIHHPFVVQAVISANGCILNSTRISRGSNQDAEKQAETVDCGVGEYKDKEPRHSNQHRQIEVSEYGQAMEYTFLISAFEEELKSRRWWGRASSLGSLVSSSLSISRTIASSY